MDSQPPSPETPPTDSAPLRRRAWKRLLAVSALILCLFAILYLFLAAPQRQFTWLTPDQIAQANRPGPFTPLKYKLMRLAGPLMRYYYSHRPNIKISTSVMTMSAATGLPALGAPSTTNADGLSAWLLSPAALASFQQALKTNSTASFIAHMNIQTADGVQSGVRMGGKGFIVAPGRMVGTGTAIDVLAKSSAGSINLLLSASSTEYDASFVPPVKTNFYTACRVQLTNAGALVINCRNTDPANSTNYWLIVSPVLVDASGKPIKP